MAARDSCTFGKLGKRTGMLLLSFLGFLFILPLCTNTAIDPQDGTINPIYDICDNGVPDVVFTAPDETHWLLKGDHSFEIDIERENASDAMRITERWLKLPGYVDLAFTLTGVEWSAVNDRTIFVRGDHYYVFKNYEYESESKTNHWFENRIGASPNEAFYDQVLYQKEDAVISFRHKKMLHLYETAMLFDDARRPERLQVYRVTAALHPTVRSILDSSQAYYFVPSVNATFHLYFQSGDEGFFCFLSAFNSPVSIAKEKLLHEFNLSLPFLTAFPLSLFSAVLFCFSVLQ